MVFNQKVKIKEEKHHKKIHQNYMTQSLLCSQDLIFTEDL